MNIVFCIKELAGIAGGAERVLADIANGLANRGHRCTSCPLMKRGKSHSINFRARSHLSRLEILGREYSPRFHVS